MNLSQVVETVGGANRHCDRGRARCVPVGTRQGGHQGSLARGGPPRPAGHGWGRLLMETSQADGAESNQGASLGGHGRARDEPPDVPARPWVGDDVDRGVGHQPVAAHPPTVGVLLAPSPSPPGAPPRVPSPGYAFSAAADKRHDPHLTRPVSNACRYGHTMTPRARAAMRSDVFLATSCGFCWTAGL
jgi:hypothetical protein